MTDTKHDSDDCADPDCLRIECVVSRATRHAIHSVNRLLSLQAQLVMRHDSVKCYLPDTEEGGLLKAYLTAGDCVELASAFTTLASVITRGLPHKGEP